MARIYGLRCEFSAAGHTHKGRTILGCTWHPDGKFRPYEVANTVRIRYLCERSHEMREAQMPVDRVRFIETIEQLSLLDLMT